MLTLTLAGAAQGEEMRRLPANEHMYPEESLVEVAGHQALYSYRPGDADKPMIVFVPGDAHMARIFYGYPGGRPQDFVAHWVSEAGYPFLAVSYPMANLVFTETSPGYTIEDWGNQVAGIVAQVIKEHSLTAPVIVCGWSMGGKIAASVGRAAKAQGTDIAMFVAMSADPPVPGFLPPANAKSIKLDGDGYADRQSIYDWFLNAIAEQNAYNGHTIIPKETYVDDFLGAVPVDLIDAGLVYRDGELVPDVAKAIKTSGAFSFGDYPFPVVLHDNSPSDLDNVLLDASDWAFVRNRVLIDSFMEGRKASELTAPQWQQLRFLVATSQQYFTEVVQGNHFFFIGELGARKAVEKILSLRARLDSLPTVSGSASPN